MLLTLFNIVIIANHSADCCLDYDARSSRRDAGSWREDASRGDSNTRTDNLRLDIALEITKRFLRVTRIRKYPSSAFGRYAFARPF